MSAEADVLVVDDDEDVRSSMADILRQAGYGVREAGSGLEALDVLSSGPVRALLLDLRMPRGDGYAVLEALENPPPVVIVSAYQVDEDEQARLVPEVAAVLKKPVPPAILLDRMATVVGQGRRP